MPTKRTDHLARTSSSPIDDCFLRAASNEEGSTELPLSALSDFPNLALMHEIWRGVAENRDSARLDATDVPPRLLPTIMIVEVDSDFQNATVRLAGTHICRLHGKDMRGITVRDFFSPDDAEMVLSAMRVSIEAFTPSLAHRVCVSNDGDRWSFTRLLLPARGPGSVNRLFEVIDPTSLTRSRGPWPPRAHRRLDD